MKLAHLTTGLKVKVIRALGAATLAGAVLVAAAPAAQAQRFVVGFGGPRVFVGVPPVVVAAPPVVVYGQPGFYAGYGYGYGGRFHRGFRGRR